MLFSEQVRLVTQEEQLVDDADPYCAPEDTDHDWTTRVAKNINLSSEKIIYVKFEGTCISACGNVRCLVDDVPLISTGYLIGGPVTREAYVVLGAGAHTFKFQTSMHWHNETSDKTCVQNIFIAALDFADRDEAVYDSGSVAAGIGAETIILSEQTVPASSARKLAVGTINKYIALILCYLTGVDYRNSIPKNSGEGNEAGKLSWKIYVDGAQKDWTDRKEDYSAYADNPTYGEGAYGFLVIPVDAGSTWKLKINVYNDTGAARNCRVYVKVVLCPWIIPNEEYEPITLDFAQGSTFYIVLEPLESDPTKAVKIGKVRFVSHGDATDFYSMASGTSLLPHSYTFETVEVEESLMLVSGFGGCISILAVDER